MKRKILYFTPRILALLTILFMMSFSADCLDFREWKEVMTCFVMHNIPAFILVAATLLAWKWELAGGLLFILLAVSGGFTFGAFTGNLWALLFIIPFLLSGILFIIHHIRYGNIAGNESQED